MKYPFPPSKCTNCNGTGLEIEPTYPYEECAECEGTGMYTPPSFFSNRMELANPEHSFDPKWQELNKSSCECGHCVGMDAVWKKLCPAGKAAAKKKFDVYPSAYANGWAVQYCRGKFKGKKK
jgi:RecJ-like exonuclease